MSPTPPLFLTDTPAARRRLREVAESTVDVVARWACAPGPHAGTDPEALAAAVAHLDPCPEDGADLDDALHEIGELVLANGVRTTDPRCAAHLQSPTLLTAAAAELAVGVTNQSLDSYDQAPAATLVEDHLVRWMARQIGLPGRASGVLTAGGTASNLLGLLLARDHHGARTGNRPVASLGLPPDASRWRILCSRAAHLSIQRAASVLGLGDRAVVPVATDRHDRMDPAALDAAVADLDLPAQALAIVATAGTTDAGAIDPLPHLVRRARDLGAWLHVDAAVGGPLRLSARLGGLLDGIEGADSVTVDLHKLCWQPIGASMLLVRDAGLFDGVRRPSDYLDRPDDDGDGLLNLVGRSLDTSRRFDALKVLISLRATGRRRLAGMIEHVVDTAAGTAALIDEHPDLELLAPASTITVLFRWRPPDRDLSPETLDRVNTEIQRALFASGTAVLGRTRTRDGTVALKLTLVNPCTTVADLAALADVIAAHPRTLEVAS